MLEYFGAETDMDCDMLWSSSQACFDEADKEYYEAHRVSAVGPDVAWANDIYSPKTKEFLAFYDETRMDHHGHVDDLEQDPMTRPRRSSFVKGRHTLQSLISHGTLHNARFHKPLASLDWSRAHCIPLDSDDVGFGLPVKLVDLLFGGVVSPCQLKEAVGLGWHFRQMGSYLMIVLSSVELKCDVFSAALCNKPNAKDEENDHASKSDDDCVEIQGPNQYDHMWLNEFGIIDCDSEL